MVLERIAKGGGATKWYHCADKTHLEVVKAELSPGSVVTFYFDGRIRNARLSPAVESNLKEIISEAGEAIIGSLRDDGLHLDVETIAGPQELADYVASLGSGASVYFGCFPARDNDGKRAVTFVLPDADGVVRPHPH